MLPPHLITNSILGLLTRYRFVWSKRSDIQPMPDDPKEVEFIYDPTKRISIFVEYDESQHPDNIVSVEWDNYVKEGSIRAEIQFGSEHIPSKIFFDYHSPTLTVVFPKEILPDWLEASEIHFTFKNGTLYNIHRFQDSPISGPDAIYFDDEGKIEFLYYPNLAIVVNIIDLHTNQFNIEGIRTINKWIGLFNKK